MESCSGRGQCHCLGNDPEQGFLRQARPRAYPTDCLALDVVAVLGSAEEWSLQTVDLRVSGYDYGAVKCSVVAAVVDMLLLGQLVECSSWELALYFQTLGHLQPEDLQQ